MKELSGSSASAVCAALRYTIAGEHSEAWDILAELPEEEMAGVVEALATLLEKARRRQTAVAVKMELAWPRKT